jgi:hypothetical protein
VWCVEKGREEERRVKRWTLYTACHQGSGCWRRTAKLTTLPSIAVFGDAQPYAVSIVGGGSHPDLPDLQSSMRILPEPFLEQGGTSKPCYPTTSVLLRAGATWTIRRSSSCEDLSYGRNRWLVNRVFSATSHSRITTTLTSTFYFNK